MKKNFYRTAINNNFYFREFSPKGLYYEDTSFAA